MFHKRKTMWVCNKRYCTGMSRIAVGGMSLLDKCIHVDQTCLVKILSNIHDMSDEKHVANLYKQV